MRRRTWFSIIGVIAVAAIVIGINMFADARLANLRVDLTRSHIYTLSAGTRQILSGLKEPITLRLFYSRRLGATVPVYGTYADHVREMLGEYAAVSGRQDQARILRPRAVQRHRGPRPCLRPAGRAGRSGRRAGLFRPRRHQPGGRRAHHRLLPAGARTLPGIRPDQAGLRPVEPEASGDRRDVVAAARRRSAHDDDGDARSARRRRPALCLDHAAAADQSGEDGHHRRAGDRSRHPGAAGGRGAEPVGCHAVCDRPVRHARRPADGDGRSVERGDGRDAVADRHAADRHRLQPEEAVRRLGHRVRSDQGGRRPDRRLAGAGQRR